MTQRTRKILAQAGSFVLAGVLLYLALRGVDFGEMVLALRYADYRWLPVVVIALIGSHVLRAWRWQMLLNALPPDGDAAPRGASLKTAFYSVMIGYMVNYAAPRLGEVARAANLAQRERRSFGGVVGTVVVERILDVIVLLLALASVFVLLLDRTAELEALFWAPIRARIGGAGALSLLALVVGVTVLIIAFVGRALRIEDSRLRRFWDVRLRPIAVSFRDGLATLVRTPRRTGLVISTLLIWFGYLLAAYLPFRMLGMTDAYGLTLLDGWCIMILGAVGVAIPSPGGTGSYHFITIQTLARLYGVDQDPAATYAVLLHGAQLVLYVMVGFACLLLQGSSLADVRETAQSAREQADLPQPVPRHEEASP